MKNGGTAVLSKTFSARKVLVISLPFWLLIPVAAYFVGGWPAFWGSVIGLAMVALYYLMAVYTAGKALKKSVGLAQGLVVGGFWLRLGLLGAILYGLSYIKEISLVAVIITFAIGYSVMLPMSIAVTMGGTKHSK